MDRAIETLKVNGYTVKLYQDDDGESPRRWDHVGTMVDWHRNYTIGDRKAEEMELTALRHGGFGLLARYLRRYEGATHVIPMGLLDHSGLYLYAEGGAHWSDSQGWDSGTVGFIYDTPKAVMECIGVSSNEAASMMVDREVRIGMGSVTNHMSIIESNLIGEIEEMSQYLAGDVYGFAVNKPDGECVESCWGFYGFDNCKAEAINIAKGCPSLAKKVVHLRKGVTLSASVISAGGRA